MQMKNVTVYVLKDHNIYWLDSFQALVELIDDARKRIPEEFFSSSRVEITTYDGDCLRTISAYYKRPETGEELSYRLFQEAEAAKNTRQQKLAQFKKLKDELGL